MSDPAARDDLAIDSLRFDQFRLDLRHGVLQRDDGTDLPLRPRSYELLVFMVRRPHELLTRDALLDALWPGLAVTDDSLTQCVSELRHALGDRGPALLRTLPRRGYMLAATISRDPQSSSAASRPSTQTNFNIPVRDPLLVEPIELACDEPQARPLAQALAADLFTAFAQSEIVSVVTRSGGANPVGYRLSCVLLQVEPETRLSVVLEDLESSRILWADQVAVPAPSARRTALFTLRGQVEVYINVDRVRRARCKADAELTPQDLIVLGREHYQRGDEENTREAQACFERSRTAAPGLGVAHGYYALTLVRCLTHGWGIGDEATQRRTVLAVARRAVDLEPRSSLCLAALAFALLHCERWDEAVETARTALRLSSLSATETRTAAAEILAAAGVAGEAATALEQTIALDPLCPPRTRAVLGRALLMANRTEEALAELHRAAAVLPDYAPCLRSIVVAAVELGRTEEARTTFAHLQRIQPNWASNSRKPLSFFRHKQDLNRFLTAFALCAAPATVRH